MTRKQKTIVWGENRPITIKLPDCYWDVLWEMANLAGKQVEELATERLKQIIIEDVVHDQGYYGELLCKGFQETLRDDKYYQAVAGY